MNRDEFSLRNGTQLILNTELQHPISLIKEIANWNYKVHKLAFWIQIWIYSWFKKTKRHWRRGRKTVIVTITLQLEKYSKDKVNLIFWNITVFDLIIRL